MRLASGLPFVQADPGQEGKIPIYGSSGLAGYGHRELTASPTLVIGRVGEGGVGSVRYVCEPAWITDNALWADRINGNWLPKFLASYLAWLDLRRFRSQTGQPLITQQVIGRCLVPQISLAEQQRITEILDSVDSQVECGRKIIMKLESQKLGLLEQFISCDTLTQPPFAAEDAIARIEAGWSPLCEERPPALGEWGILKVSSVTSGRFLPDESKALLPGMAPRPEIAVDRGDILMCRANGAKELVGAVVLVDIVPPNLMLSDKTLRLVPNRETVIPEYLYFFMASGYARRQMAVLLSGSSGQNNISQQFIRSMKMTIPDHARQRQIVDTMNALDSRMRAEEKTVESLEQFKQGLIDDLLTGRVRVGAGSAEPSLS